MTAENKIRKCFVTGVNGQLGHDVINELCRRGVPCVASDITPVYSGFPDGSAVTKTRYIRSDITNGSELASALESEAPDVVIHCAAWTAVDAAELPENSEKVMLVNFTGTRNIAEICKKLGAVMIYISTDYVFGGEGDEPRKPDEKELAPLNRYALSKMLGERAVAETLEKYYIVRTAWVFGANGNNFIKTMLKLSKSHDSLRVVNDQIGTPTYTADLASLLCDMAQSDKYGIYHATNEGGFISWADFAKEIFRQSGRSVEVIPVTTEEYGVSIAKRPKNSRLDKSKLKENGFVPLPDWRDALKRYLEETGEK